MSSQASVFLLEFNELTPAVIARFMEKGSLPNFRRFFQKAQVYTTDAERIHPISSLGFNG
jgi:hypothetical protein